jgi:hypothetical protein
MSHHTPEALVLVQLLPASWDGHRHRSARERYGSLFEKKKEAALGRDFLDDRGRAQESSTTHGLALLVAALLLGVWPAHFHSGGGSSDSQTGVEVAR